MLLISFQSATGQRQRLFQHRVDDLFKRRKLQNHYNPCFVVELALFVPLPTRTMRASAG